MTTVAATPPYKRTFKEKLRDLVAHAEQQQAQAIREEHNLDVRSFATDLLIRGYPNAFAEFHLFAVSEAREVTQNGGDTERGQQGGNDTIRAYRGPDHEAHTSETSLSIPTLRTIHTHLMRAEQSRRDDDFHGQSAAYNELGLFFEQVGNLPLAAYQYRRCLDIAEELNWLEGCLAAHTTLGLVKRQQGHLEESLRHHEQQLVLAEQLDNAEEVAAAHEQLVQARSMLAEAAADSGKLDEATSQLQGCIAAAQACGNRAAEGACCHQLGMIAQQKGEFNEALQCQDTFLELIGEAGSPEDIARAHFCAAECHEALSDIDRAITELETYLDMTRQSSPLAHGRACCKFGSLCYRMGQFSQAVMYFEKFFEVARNLGDNRILDIARFNLGVARGSVWKQEFLGIVDKDVDKLLNWKNMRISFTDQF